MTSQNTQCHPLGRAWRPQFSATKKANVPLGTTVIQELYRCPDLLRIVHLDIRDQHLIPPTSENDASALQKDLANVTDIAGGDNSLTLETFSRMPRLQQLELQNNGLTRIPVLSEKDFLLLKTLDMSKNNLGNECIEALSFLPVLRALNIAYNEITKFEFDNSTRYSCLTHLNLTGNRITSLGIGDLPKLSLLTELNLSRNRITKVALLDENHQLCFLDVSCNRVPDGHVLAKLQRLCLVSFAGNRMTKYQQDNITRVFVKTKCHVLMAETEAKHAAGLSAALCGDMSDGTGRRTLPPVRRFLAERDTIDRKSKLAARCLNVNDVNNALTNEEVAELTAGGQNLPRPKDLEEYYKVLDEFLHKPRTSVAGLMPKKIDTTSPVARVKHHHKIFWDAVEGLRDKMEQNWMWRDRLSDAVPGPLTPKRRKTLTKPQIVKHQLKKYNLEKAMKNILQIDVNVFRELLAYRKRIIDNRELVYELKVC